MKTLDTKVLQNVLNAIEDYLPHSQAINTKVSKVNVAWHLDHSLKVINAVITTMQKSDPLLYEANFSVLGKLLLAFKFFPRGKAKAPKHVLPPEIITSKDLEVQIQFAKSNIEVLKGLDTNTFFKHPMFGNVNKPRVVRFLDVHTNHHLKIVKNIVK